MTTSTQDLIYNELCLMRQDFSMYVAKMDKRVGALEAWRDKMIGIFIAIGVAIKYSWDFIKERIV